MAEIRLSKLTKQFSIGLARLVDFLNEQGANVEMNPNAKVSDEYLPAIEAKFGEDQKLKSASLRSITLSCSTSADCSLSPSAICSMTS